MKQKIEMTHTPRPGGAEDALSDVVAYLVVALRAAQQFLDPEVDRGPAVNGWQNTVDIVAAALSKALSQT